MTLRRLLLASFATAVALVSQRADAQACNPLPPLPRGMCSFPDPTGENDCDGDGCKVREGDCNDCDAVIRGALCPGGTVGTRVTPPGAGPEICDGKDNSYFNVDVPVLFHCQAVSYGEPGSPSTWYSEACKSPCGNVECVNGPPDERPNANCDGDDIFTRTALHPEACRCNRASCPEGGPLRVVLPADHHRFRAAEPGRHPRGATMRASPPCH